MSKENSNLQAESEKVYQLKVELDGTAVWRRFLIMGFSSFAELHDCLQPVMGWDNYHLYMFRSGQTEIGPQDPDEPGDWLDADEEFIDEYFKAPGNSVRYIYDLGDSWEHTVTVEKILTFEEADGELPRCTDGSGACPPEDCGGIPGYERLLKSLTKPGDPEARRAKQWLHGGTDPAVFSVAAANQALAAALEEADAVEEPVSDKHRYSAVIVHPQKPFIEWLRKSAHGISKENVESLALSDPSCWLLPQVEDFPDESMFQELLDTLKEDLFERELARWSDDRASWPKDRSAQSFDRYFTLQLCTNAQSITEISPEYHRLFHLQDDATQMLDGAVQEVVDEQLASKNPPHVHETYERLRDMGIEDGECRRLIGCAVSDEIRRALELHEEYNEKRYMEKLDQLPLTPWLDE